MRARAESKQSEKISPSPHFTFVWSVFNFVFPSFHQHDERSRNLGPTNMSMQHHSAHCLGTVRSVPPTPTTPALVSNPGQHQSSLTHFQGRAEVIPRVEVVPRTTRVTRARMTKMVRMTKIATAGTRQQNSRDSDKVRTSSRTSVYTALAEWCQQPCQYQHSISTGTDDSTSTNGQNQCRAPHRYRHQCTSDWQH